MLDITTHPAIEKLKADIDEIGLKVSTSYTLADAIREGSGVTEQCVGNWAGPSGEVCALSAGWLAAKARGYVS